MRHVICVDSFDTVVDHFDGGPTLKQHWVNASRLLGCYLSSFHLRVLHRGAVWFIL